MPRTHRAGHDHAEQLGPTGAPAYRRFGWTTLMCGAVVAAAAELMYRSVEPGVDRPWASGFILLLMGFFVAEYLTMDLNVRRFDWTISFTEVPLVIGLLTMPFSVVLTAHLTAGITVQLWRRAWPHLPYNVGVMCFEIAVPFGLFTLLHPLHTVPIWSQAVLATVASPLLSTAFGLSALHRIGVGLGRREAARLAFRTLVVGMLNTTVGVMCYLAVQHTPWGLALAVLVTVTLIAVVVAYSQVLREQRDFSTFSAMSLDLAACGAEQDDEALRRRWQMVGAELRNQLGARRVVLRIFSELASTTAGRTCVLEVGDRAPQIDIGLQDPLLRLSSTGIYHHQRDQQFPEVTEALVQRDAVEALTVPLHTAQRTLGIIEAHDKDSRFLGFCRGDERLLRTVAGHLTTAAENRRLTAQLRHDAYHDPQTGLLNRPGFLAAAAGHSAATPGGVLVRADLDVLDSVSDALGYAWSDRLIFLVGKRLRDAVGRDVPLARLEGCAYAVLFAPTTAVELNRLRETLSTPYTIDKIEIETRAQLGYCTLTEELFEHGQRPPMDRALQRADVALRVARAAGESVREYSPSMGSVFLRRFQLVTQFRQAMDRGDLEVHFQPKVGLHDQRVLGLEALVRWCHPELGAVAPDEFVPAVEATGLVDLLTSFVTDAALALARGFIDNGVRMSIAVNLSVRNLADPNFCTRVGALLERHEVPAELLTFEITESGVMADPQRAMPVLRSLHALGVRLSLDDFGTGYSSLAYLRQLPVDEVKIDKSFVLGMGTDLGDLAVVRSIVDLGHSLSLVVVAEGVEDDAARETLRAMGCDVAQGYLFARPLSRPRLKSWIAARTSRETEGDMLTLTW